jgi:hypothetical protein
MNKFKRGTILKHPLAATSAVPTVKPGSTSTQYVVQCQRARALRYALRQHWILPDEEQFLYMGKDWLLLLLDRRDEEQSLEVLRTLGVHLKPMVCARNCIQIPSEGWTKINVDGSFMESSGEAGFGAVTRYSNAVVW